METKKLFKTFITLSLLILFPFSLNASEENKEIIKGNLYKMGDVVELNQEVSGDVMAMAQTLKINSPIKGDLIALAENIEINADIEGSVRVACNDITVNSKIARNANILAITAQIKEKTTIEKDLLFLSENFSSKGNIKGNIGGISENVELGNLVEGNINLRMTGKEKLIIPPDTNIKGALNYTASKQAEIDKKVNIFGGVKQILPKEKESKPFDAFGKLISLFSMIAIGMVVLIIDKKNTMRAVDAIIKKPSKSLAFGILYLIITPILAIVLMFTIIGFPIALILLAIYFILFYVGQIFSGIALGEILMKNRIENDIWKMVVGLFTIILLASIPYIGISIKLIFILLGMGAIVNTKREMLREINK